MKTISSNSSADTARVTGRRVDRETSWGQDYRQSPMDRFGIWLSTVQIRRRFGSFRGKAIADFGCGYHAAFARELLEEVASATLVDLTLSPELKRYPRVRCIEGIIPDALLQIPSQTLDLVICNNVLEHLWDPVLALEQVRRVLKPGGQCFLNVPSWRGKVVLETAAFRLGLTSKQEIDDHKAYYDAHELWALVVRSGFKPSQITCKTHKFGLNTFAVCRLD